MMVHEQKILGKADSRHVLTLVILFSAFLALLATALQYPLKAHFPLGGDAATFVINTRNILSGEFPQIRSVLISTWYPAIYPVFSASALLPFIDWPTRFMWWMALGQIASGLALGFLAYRLAGKQSAAIAMWLWGLTPIVLSGFFEDGTLAQLWSLVWLALFFERAAAGSTIGLGILLVIAVIGHPLTAIVLLASLIIMAATLVVSRTLRHLPDRSVYVLLIPTLITSIVTVAVLWVRHDIFSLPFPNEHSLYFDELVFGFFSPWVLVAIGGFFEFMKQHRTHIYLTKLMGGFIFVVIFLSTSNLLGIGFWTNRFTPYLVFAVCLFASYIFPTILGTVIKNKWVATLFLIILMLVSTVNIWRENGLRYKFYEGNSRNLILLKEEKEAIDWLGKNVPPESQIYTSDANRHTEWGPALTNLAWHITKGDSLTTMKAQIHTSTPSFVVYFLHRESIPEEVTQDTSHYHIVFQNKSALIAQFIP